MLKKRILSNLLLLSLIFSLVPMHFASAGVWGDAEIIESDNTADATSARIAFDSSGNAIAVWEQSDGTRLNIWANKYNGTSWGTAELIESDNTGYATNARIAFDSSGNAIAVWAQSDGTRLNIWANKYNGTSWGTAELIESNNAGTTGNPEIAFDSSGNAIAVWRQNDGTRFNILANKYNGTSWGTAELIESDNTGAAADPQIAFDGSGSAIAVWYQSDGVNNNVYANKYNGTSWGTAELIESDDTGSALASQIAVDGNGNAIVVWQQYDGDSIGSIWANKYNGTSWGTAELIESSVSDASFPQIAFDDNGNAIAVWALSEGMIFPAYIWANKYNGTSWGTAELIEVGAVGAISGGNGPQVGFDSNGNAIAVWYEDDGTRFNIWANKYTGNIAPVLSSATAVAPNGNGDVNVSVVVNDDDDNNLTVSYYYAAGACSSYSSQPASTLRSASDGAGSVTVSSGTATSVATTSADNTLVAVWDTVADIGDTRGDYCVYIIANDGTVDSNEVSATVNISGSGGGSSSDDNTQGTAVGADVSENGEDLDGDHVEDAQSIEQVTETNTEDPTTTEDQQSIEQPQTDTSTETSNQSNDDANQPIPESFTDTAGTWAQSYIEKLRESGIVVGTAESTKTVNGELVAAFEPDAVVTRGQLVKMAMKAFGYSVQKFDKTSFTDVPTSHDFAMYIESAKQAGYIGGYSDGTFHPDEAVNRAEALVIILKFSGLDLKSEGKIDFPDVASRAWYRDILAYAVEHKIISGYENGNFGPGDSLTRSQAAKILVLVMESL